MAILEIETRSRQEVARITEEVAALVRRSGWKNGFCQLFVPHTTAAITVNEDADPDVVMDILHALEQFVPSSNPAYRHSGGDSAAHVKASLMGCFQMLPVHDGRLALGEWQQILLCEFDGPRRRQVVVDFLPVG